MNPRARLHAAAARAEQLAARNRAQAAMLRTAARRMGDQATRFIDATNADDASVAHATRERYVARTLAVDPET